MKTPKQNTPQTDLRKQAEEILDAAIKWEYVNVPEKDKPDFAKLRPCSPRKAALNAMLDFHQSQHQKMETDLLKASEEYSDDEVEQAAFRDGFRAAQSPTQPETLLNTERVELIEDIEDAQEKFIQLLLPEIYGEDPDCELIYETFEDCKKFLKSLFGQPETLGKGKDIAKRFISAMTNDDEVNVFQPLSWLGTLLRLLYRPEVLNMLVSHSDNDDDAVITMLSYVDKLDKSCNELLGFCQSLSEQPEAKERKNEARWNLVRNNYYAFVAETKSNMPFIEWCVKHYNAPQQLSRLSATESKEIEKGCPFDEPNAFNPEGKSPQFNIGDEIIHTKYGEGENICNCKNESEQVDLNYESLRRNVRTISDRIGSLCALYFSPACEDHEAVLKKITFEVDLLDKLTKPSTH